MAYIVAHPMECAVYFVALVLLAGMILLICRERKLERRTAEMQERLLRRMDEISNSITAEKTRMERELKESYDATNRVVAELVRAQQTRLDAFSGQMASWKPNDPAEPDARIDELLEEVRRAGNVLHNGKASVQGLATREELSAYFADLEKELRRIETEVRAIPASAAPDPKEDAEVQKLCDSAQNELDLFNEALKRMKKRLRQANESMEDAARHSKRFQKKMIRNAGENE